MTWGDICQSASKNQEKIRLPSCARSTQAVSFFSACTLAFADSGVWVLFLSGLSKNYLNKPIIAKS